jgi:FkbM family methyltransferase
MKPFTEELRYEYPLKPDDLVVDVGGYEGKFANEIRKRYGCRVWCFEPVFHQEIRSKLYPGIKLFTSGIGRDNYDQTFQIKGDMTGAWADGSEIEVSIVNVNEVLNEPVALLKLNCEGGEYEILEAILDDGDPLLFDNIQVQFHPIFPDSEQRWQKIRERLLVTHELTYDAPWCWENYKRK